MNQAPSLCRLCAILLMIAGFALLPRAEAVSPAPDGCYPNFTTAEGCNALQNLVGGAGNSGLGWYALFSTVEGSFNTGVGGGALVLNTADSNTAVGAAALLLNTTGTQSVAVGTDALVFNNADDNTAVGFFALEQNVSAVTNAALGTFAAENNDSSGNGTADFNVAIGGFALQANVDGTRNTAVGAGAMESADGGSDNTAVGELAGNVLGAGSGNICIGSGAGTVAPMSGEYNNTILLGISGDSNANSPNGRCYIGNIRDVTTGSGGAIPVLIDPDGQLGTMSSSRQFKKDIKPMDQASEGILKLNPVTFHYKNHRDIKKSKQELEFGLIAEDVAEVNPDLVARNKDGEIYSVRYDAVNVMLLNEFLKQHKKVEEQQANITQLNSKMVTQAAIIARQQKGMEVLTAQVKEQAAQIQKVSAQIQLNKSAARTVASGQ
ncbi:MAG TPA: tail fiber domain-containing protein [Candidatus Udaeobacter sp.]